MLTNSGDELVDVPTFSEPDELSDLILIVEAQRLFVHRIVLATASPVWRRMFLGNFQEKTAQEITLPHKKRADVVELLQCIYPSCRKRVNSDNALSLLPLAEEYQVIGLKRECELTLSQLIGKTTVARRLIHFLAQAERFNLPRLFDKAATLAGRLSLQTLEPLEEYQQLDRETIDQVQRRRIEHLESANKSLGDSVEKLQKELKDTQERAERDKVEIRKSIDRIAYLWSPSAWQPVCCSDHHAPPFEKCLECNAAIRQEVLSMLGKLTDASSGIEWPPINAAGEAAVDCKPP